MIRVLLANLHAMITLASSSELRFARRAAIDARVLELQAEIQQLYRERNSFADISCLPYEVLEHIFMIYAQSQFRGPDSNLRWLRRFNICHDWPWTDEMLIRSKNAPIFLTLNIFAGPSCRENFERALKHIARTTELTISAPSMEMDGYCQRFIEPAPLVSKLLFWGDSFEGKQGIDHLWDALTFRSNHGLQRVAFDTDARYHLSKDEVERMEDIIDVDWEFEDAYSGALSDDDYSDDDSDLE